MTSTGEWCKLKESRMSNSMIMRGVTLEVCVLEYTQHENELNELRKPESKCNTFFLWWDRIMADNMMYRIYQYKQQSQNKYVHWRNKWRGGGGMRSIIWCINAIQNNKCIYKRQIMPCEGITCLGRICSLSVFGWMMAPFSEAWIQDTQQRGLWGTRADWTIVTMQDGH